MDYSHTFYEVAQRMIWAETTLVKRLRRGQYDLQTAGLVLKAPLYRAATRLLSATHRPQAIAASTSGRSA